MRWVGIVALLFFSGACATTRVVRVDVGGGRTVAHESVDIEPVEVSEEEFKSALTRLILEMRMDVAFREADAVDQQGWSRSRTLLASSKGLTPSAITPRWSSVLNALLHSVGRRSAAGSV
jgi:hypothetical protein